MPTVLTIDGIRNSIAERRTTATALAEEFYTRIKQEDPEIGAFLTLSKSARKPGPRRLTASPKQGVRCRPSPEFPSRLKM